MKYLLLQLEAMEEVSKCMDIDLLYLIIDLLHGERAK